MAPVKAMPEARAASGMASPSSQLAWCGSPQAIWATFDAELVEQPLQLGDAPDLEAPATDAQRQRRDRGFRGRGFGHGSTFRSLCGTARCGTSRRSTAPAAESRLIVAGRPAVGEGFFRASPSWRFDLSRRSWRRAPAVRRALGAEDDAVLARRSWPGRGSGRPRRSARRPSSAGPAARRPGRGWP